MQKIPSLRFVNPISYFKESFQRFDYFDHAPFHSSKPQGFLNFNNLIFLPF